MNEDGLELVIEHRLGGRFRADAESVDSETAVRAVMQRARDQRQDPAQRGVMVRMVAGVVAITLTFVVGTAILAIRPSGEPAAPAPPAPVPSQDAEICYTGQWIPVQSPDPDELDALIEAAGGPERKLTQKMYAGSAEGAARAFGGTLGEPTSSQYEIIDIPTERGVDRLLLRRFQSTAGVPVWIASDRTRAGPCRAGPTNTPRPTLDPAGPRPSTSFELYTHCGVERSLIRFDGSYWRALSAPSGPLADPFDQGTMTLLSADRAEYVSDSGTTVLLERLSARPSFVPCR
jgi:hypothetical protein